MKTLTWSVASIASIFCVVATTNGCAGDEPARTQVPESGTGEGTGGRTGGSGGGTSTSGGATSSGGATQTCSFAVGTTCDGKEDCPAGQLCCGSVMVGMGMGTSGTHYTKFGCYDSCTALGGDASPMAGGLLYYEVCNPADTCEDTTATCGTSQFLPDSLSRCLPANTMAMNGTPDSTLNHNKNEINCGKSVCGATEQCCIRQPLDPYCAPKTATCECNAPGSGDGGGGRGGAASGSGGAAGAATGGAPADAAAD